MHQVIISIIYIVMGISCIACYRCLYRLAKFRKNQSTKDVPEGIVVQILLMFLWFIFIPMGMIVFKEELDLLLGEKPD